MILQHGVTARSLPAAAQAHGSREHGMTRPPAPLADFAAQIVGGLRAVIDRSWPRNGSNVWELVSDTGQHCYLKRHSSALFHQREVSAYQRWTTALGAGRAPLLVAADPHLRAIVVTAVPGRPVHGQQPLADTEAEIYRQAGMLLRRLHDASPSNPPGTSQAVARADDQLQRSGGLIDCAQARLIRAHAARLDQIAPLIPAVPVHRDAQPRNFLWDATTRRLALIDFERAEYGPAVRDLVRLEYGPWDGRSDLSASFLAGYGRTLTAAEETALPSLAALDALSGLLWGTASNDPEVVARARRTLDRLSVSRLP